MNIYDFISQEELEALPEDNRLAFAEFARLGQVRLRERLEGLDGIDEVQWLQIQEAKLGYMNVVLAAGKRYKIEPFASQSLPKVKGFNSDIYDQFKSDLDHYLAQIILDASARSRHESVELSGQSRDRIRAYIHGLRECIDKSSMDSSTKDRLYAKIAEFEAVLEKRRLSLLAATLLSVQILGVPGALWATGDVATKLISQIMQAVAEAKVAEDLTRLPFTEAPAMLEAPRPPAIEFEGPSRRRPSQDAPAFDSNDDSDIPF